MQRIPAWGFLFVACAATIFAQSGGRETQPATASISGRVLIDGKPARGIAVQAMNIESSKIFEKQLSGFTPMPQAVTDEEGHFSLNNLESGKYVLNAVAPAMVLIYEASVMKLFDLKDRTAVENIVLSLTRGGVITGRVTHADGSPVIGASVDYALEPSREKDQITTPRYIPLFRPEQVGATEKFRTDDRGIYRIYGLVEGRYKISLSFSGDKSVNSRHYPLTVFYPNTSDATKAIWVKVETGTETRDVDIRLGPPEKLYTVIGRVIEAETGNPLPAFAVNLGGRQFAESTTNNQGVFRFDYLPPGKYSAREPRDDTDQKEYYSESPNFEVTSGDVDGVEVRVHKGLNLSGVVVTEIPVDDATKAKLQPSKVRVVSLGEKSNNGTNYAIASSISTTDTAADGSFLIKGVSPGHVNVWFSALDFAMVRLERGGKDVTQGFELQPGENVNDFRITVAETDCAIRGQIVVKDGALPDGAYFSIYARRINGDNPDFYYSSFTRTTSADPNGRFLSEGLVAGQYELILIAEVRSKSRIDRWITKQKVSVASKQIAETTITLDLNADKEK